MYFTLSSEEVSWHHFTNFGILYFEICQKSLKIVRSSRLSSEWVFPGKDKKRVLFKEKVGVEGNENPKPDPFDINMWLVIDLQRQDLEQRVHNTMEIVLIF